MDALEGEPATLDALPAEYMARERAFMEVGLRFVDLAGPGVVCHELHAFDGFPARRDPGLHPVVYDLGASDDVIERVVKIHALDGLSTEDRALLFRMAARDLLALRLTGPDGMTLATMDDGFYWFVSLPDDIDAARITDDPVAVIHDSIDVFDPA